MELMVPWDGTELDLKYDTKNIKFVDPEHSYDHFSDTNGSIFQKIKLEKIGLEVMAKI